MPQPLSETVSVRRCSFLLSLTSIVISDAPADMEFWAISRMLSDSSRMALSVQVFVENAVYLIGGESAVDIVVDRHDGASPHAPMQRQASMEKHASSLHSPGPMPSLSLILSRIACEPLT